MKERKKDYLKFFASFLIRDSNHEHFSPLHQYKNFPVRFQFLAFVIHKEVEKVIVCNFFQKFEVNVFQVEIFSCSAELFVEKSLDVCQFFSKSLRTIFGSKYSLNIHFFECQQTLCWSERERQGGLSKRTRELKNCRKGIHVNPAGGIKSFPWMYKIHKKVDKFLQEPIFFESG